MSICPVCGSENNIDIFKIDGQPRYALQRHTSRESALECKKEDVHFVFCVNCQFTYNQKFDADVMDYQEDIDTSRRYSEYFNNYIVSVCKDVDEVFSVAGKRVVEIGCGDGQFLIELRKLFICEAWGFDPSLIRSDKVPHFKDIRFLPDYYNSDYLNKNPDLIVLRHILEHIANPKEFLTSIIPNRENHPVGIYVEIPSWEWIVDNDQVMMFSNDHCSYYSENSLKLVLGLCGFKCEKVSTTFENEYLQYFGSKDPVDHAYESRKNDREDHVNEYPGADLTNRTKAFIERMGKIIGRFKLYFSEISSDAVLWGAGGKGTVLLPTLGISYKQMPFVVDSNPNKHDTYIPVTGQQIIAPGQLKSLKPRYVLITNPSYYKEIASQLDSLGVCAQIITIK